MDYGKRINKLRQNKNMTQKELALKLFVTDKTISSWESNRTEPSLEMVIKLSEILECSASYILYGDNYKNPIEMEIKIKITKEEYDFLNRTMSKNGKFLYENNQNDIYYKSNSLGCDKNKWLRIRESGNKKILTYKDNNHSNYCDEYEVEIDSINNLKKIFECIGIYEFAKVNKFRKIYTYLDEYEVSIDDVKNLGYFIEIEVKKNIDNYLEEYDSLLSIAKKLGLNLNNIEKSRYPQMMVNNK